MTSADRRCRWLLLLTGVVVLAAGLGLRSPWPPDEPRFALIARDMAAGGDWLFPRVGGVLYADKPPLFFWLVGGLYRLVGSIDVAFLLPGLASGLLVLGLVTDLGTRLRDARTGIWCGAALLATVQFPLQMRGGQIDALLCLWTTLALYGFCRHLLLGPDWRWYAVGGAAAGFGVLTKGVGFLPYLVFLPYAFAIFRAWPLPPVRGSPGRWLLAPAATVTVIAAWLLPMLAAVASSNDQAPAAYRDDILFHQTVDRYAASWGHIKPPWYLLTNALPWLWLPLTLFLPWLAPAWRRDLSARDPAVLLLTGWVVLVLLFFSASPGKRSVYIFPALPALALLAGMHARQLVQRAAVVKLLFGFAWAQTIALVALAAVLMQEPAAAAAWIAEPRAVLAAARGAGMTGLAMLATLAWHRLGWRRVAFALAVFWVGTGLLVAPAIDADRSGARLMRSVEGLMMPGSELGLVDWPEQFLLESRKPVYHFGYRREPRDEVRAAAAWVAASPGRALLLPAPRAAECFARRQVQTVGRAHRRVWVLVRGGAPADRCADPIGTVYRYQPPQAKDLHRIKL